MVVDLSLLVKLVADLHGITASRVYQLVKSYRQSGVCIPSIKNVGALLLLSVSLYAWKLSRPNPIFVLAPKHW